MIFLPTRIVHTAKDLRYLLNIYLNYAELTHGLACSNYIYIVLIFLLLLHTAMKKCSEATQTLRAGCSNADPQTHTQNRQGRLQYTAQLSAQCN